MKWLDQYFFTGTVLNKYNILRCPQDYLRSILSFNLQLPLRKQYKIADFYINILSLHKKITSHYWYRCKVLFVKATVLVLKASCKTIEKLWHWNYTVKWMEYIIECILTSDFSRHFLTWKITNSLFSCACSTPTDWIWHTRKWTAMFLSLSSTKSYYESKNTTLQLSFTVIWVLYIGFILGMCLIMKSLKFPN